MAFTQTVVDCFKEAFALFDKKGHGVVSTEDLGRVMKVFNLNPSQVELHNMITEVDGSGKGAVDFAEFMKMMARGGGSVTNEMKETYTIFTEGRPKLTAGDLKRLFSILGENIDDAGIQEMIKVAGGDSGGITYEQFEHVVTQAN